jgi:hypothetical protein
MVEFEGFVPCKSPVSVALFQLVQVNVGGAYCIWRAALATASESMLSPAASVPRGSALQREKAICLYGHTSKYMNVEVIQ